MSFQRASLLRFERLDPEQCLVGYTALTPIWWATGTLVPLGILGVVWLYATRPETPASATVVSWLWFSIGLSQALSAIINWSSGDQGLEQLVHMLVSLSCTGWVLLGMCVAVGASYRLSSSFLIRAVCIQSGWVLILGTLSYLYYHGTGSSELAVPSLASALGSVLGRSADSYFMMHFYHQEEFMGGDRFRLTLFYPWPTGLALASVVPILIAWREPSPTWRTIGVFGGLVGAVFSFSRAVFVGLAVAGAALTMLRARTITRLSVVIGVGLTANVALLLGFNPVTTLSDAYDAFTQARAGSSEGRDLLYQAAWSGFLQSPWIGHGWFGENYARWMPLPIGSHSTFYGVLYRGGIITFSFVCLAFASSVIACAARLAAGSKGAAQAMALLLVYGMSAYGENMETLVPYLFLGFLWLGGEMASDADIAVLGSVPTRALNLQYSAWRRTI